MPVTGLPAPLLTRAAWLAAAGIGVVALAAAQVQQAAVLSRAFTPRATALAALVFLVALRGLRPHHPFAHLGPANVVTGARALLVALLAAVALEPATAVAVDGSASGALAPGAAWWVVALAAVSAAMDLADGWLARRTRLASAFGARFDMEIDALLILVLSLLVWRTGKAGAWVAASGLMRYAFVAAAAVLPWMHRALPASRRRQAVCVVQIAALVAALAPLLPVRASGAVCAVSLALLAWSFWVDVSWLVRRRTDAVPALPAIGAPVGARPSGR